ncbi:hypothetical protein [Alkaliphilus sp. B6464]|uniref:hypothetical protein n=1 Tax=Alkaliphilus sp. B6464 TaxID=2731219 RepID=UPI001BAD5DD0|nr:hypothetical protein [Alkaliphilus sp. B6464]QUH22215.1 hypothetical protein HYG84_20115 [Alkaliphilus sp. B6464]
MLIDIREYIVEDLVTGKRKYIVGLEGVYEALADITKRQGLINRPLKVKSKVFRLKNKNTIGYEVDIREIGLEEWIKALK